MQKISGETGSKHPIIGKLLFSAFIAAAYLFGKKIPVPWVIPDEHATVGEGLQGFVRTALGSDMSQNSVLSIGFMPYMTASIIVSLWHCLTREDKSSSRQMMREIRLLTLLAALLQSVLHTGNMTYREMGPFSLPLLRFMTVVVLTGGAFALVWMSERCRRWGLGGSQILILVNLLENFWRNEVSAAAELQKIGVEAGKWMLAGAAACILTALVTILMERSELQIPIRRVMIHNSFAGDSNMAIKLSPVGTMPAMYVMTLFAVPYYLCELFVYLAGENPVIAVIQRNLNLQSLGGILLFLILLIALNFLLAEIYIDPQGTAENLQKSGDYIPGVHPGTRTRCRITGDVRFTSCVSSLVMGGIIVLPLLLQVRLGWSNSIFTMPMSVMILTGLLLGMLEEIHVIRVVNRYREFPSGL